MRRTERRQPNDGALFEIIKERRKHCGNGRVRDGVGAARNLPTYFCDRATYFSGKSYYESSRFAMV